MNHYTPKEVETEPGSGIGSGLFEMTVTRDGVVRPIGYCAGGECRHMTPEDASICYRKWLQDHNGGRWPGGFLMKDSQKKSTRVINMHSSY